MYIKESTRTILAIFLPEEVHGRIGETVRFRDVEVLEHLFRCPYEGVFHRSWYSRAIVEY